MTETFTIESADLRELAVEIRALRRDFRKFCRNAGQRERKMLELFGVLSKYLEDRMGPPPVVPRPGTMREARIDALRRALASCRGSKAEAARILGLNVKTVFNLMRQSGIPWDFGQARVPAVR